MRKLDVGRARSFARPRTSNLKPRTFLLVLLALAACGERPYDRTLRALADGDLRGAEEAARAVGGPTGTFLLGNVAFAECRIAARQAGTAAAEPFAYDVAIQFAEKAERYWREAAMSRDDWPAARRNVERAQAKADELRRLRREAQDRMRPKPKPQPKPQPKPKPTPEEKKTVTEEDPDVDPMLRELPPEEVARIAQRLAEKEKEKRAMRRKEREKRSAARDW